MTNYTGTLNLTKEMAKDNEYAYDTIGVIDANGECKCHSCATEEEIATMSTICSSDDPLLAYAECVACGYPLTED